MKLIYTFCILSLFGLGGALHASKPQVERLSETVEAALDVVYGDCCVNATLAEKQQKVRELLESRYDFSVLLRRAIGRNWNLMSEGEQVQVLDLVERLVVKAYVESLDGKVRPEVSFEKPLSISDKRMEIPSTIVVDGKPIYVLYRMGLMESGWQIYDIVAEGISVVSNYRQQFDDHFRKGNGAELIVKLEELLNKNDNIDTHEDLGL
jgi:phospholipid transport system substrate-binding protein